MSEVVLSGSLSRFKLPEILTFLQATRKSGTLTLSNGRKETFVFFDDGSVIYAASNQEQFRLVSVLQRKRKITPEQMTAIDDLMRQTGGRFGEVAVQHGVLTDEQVRDFLKVQVSEILYDVFVWDGGAFHFVEEMRLPDYAVTIAIDLSNLIMEGARRIEEWGQCLQLLPDPSVVFRVVARPGEEKVTLTADEWKILFMINGQRTLEELCHDAEDEPFQVYRVVYGLQANNLLEVVPRERLLLNDERPASPVQPHIPTDETMRQIPAQFRSETTVREPSDDTNLLVSSAARLSYRDVVRPTVAQIEIRNGEVQHQTIPLTDPEYLIGRHRDNSIQIVDLGVSAFHARLYRGPDGYAIEDLKSRNGVWLNGQRVSVSPLKDGDRLRLGQTEIAYSILYDSALPLM